MSIIEKALAKKKKDSQSLNPDQNEQAEHQETSPIQKEEVSAAPHAILDITPIDKLGLIEGPNSQNNGQLANEYRSIKQKLLNNAYGSGSSLHTNGNMIMVSSANASEGKTFTSVNLALSIATEKDKTVLLVDADVLRPAISTQLNLLDKPGLIDYLQGDITALAQVIYSTSVPNLKIIPAGRANYLSNELLASDKMKTLSQELATRYGDRVVLFDCPPLVGVVETLTLSKYVGQAIIVVEQDKTKMTDVDTAIAELNRDLAIGLVLNKATRGIVNQYGYGFRYGQNDPPRQD